MPSLEKVECRHRDVFIDADTSLDHIYFPDLGVISVVAVYPDGSVIETATVGREGCTGFQAYFGARISSVRFYVQMPGTAARMSRTAFLEAMETHPQFHQVIHAYVQVFLEQVMISTGCNGIHNLTQRLARWLLMLQDRGDGNSLPMTQDLLAEMLGVQRQSVSHAIKRLKQTGCIEPKRKNVIITSRDRLQSQSCECYQVLRSRISHHLPKTYSQTSTT